MVPFHDTTMALQLLRRENSVRILALNSLILEAKVGVLCAPLWSSLILPGGFSLLLLLILIYLVVVTTDRVLLNFGECRGDSR